MAKNKDEKMKVVETRNLMKSPDKAPKGNHTSDKSKSNKKFEKEEFAKGGKSGSSETLKGDYAKDRKNLKVKHKGKKQL